MPISDYSDWKRGCESYLAMRVGMRRSPRRWIIKPVPGADGCVNIISAKNRAGCGRYLSGDAACKSRIRTVKQDDGSGMQRWRFVKTNFRLADNNVTVVCPEAKVGESGMVGGIVYTKRDRNGLLKLMNDTNMNNRLDTESMLASSCTTGVANMSQLFVPEQADFSRDWLAARCSPIPPMWVSLLNPDISTWDTSSVEDMAQMFLDSHFNRDIRWWETSAVRNMRQMFLGSAFNQPISNWNTSAVTNMEGMFALGVYGTSSGFSQPIGTWDTSAVTDMSYMFAANGAFNQNIGEWNTSSVTNMARMFGKASVCHSTSWFNKPIGAWDTGLVTNMEGMFAGNLVFNQNISNWNTSSVKNMMSMFSGTSNFNQSIGNWDTSAVTTMVSMFHNATAFNQDLRGWNVANVNKSCAFFDDGTAPPKGAWISPKPPLPAICLS